MNTSNLASYLSWGWLPLAFVLAVVFAVLIPYLSERVRQRHPLRHRPRTDRWTYPPDWPDEV
jgi:hypothetical protein